MQCFQGILQYNNNKQITIFILINQEFRTRILSNWSSALRKGLELIFLNISWMWFGINYNAKEDLIPIILLLYVCINLRIKKRLFYARLKSNAKLYFTKNNLKSEVRKKILLKLEILQIIFRPLQHTCYFFV